MCGIVGHIGPQNTVDVVIKGLQRLEYRGYDSAGISVINEKGELEIYKKTGKIENLIGLLADKNIHARACIGHTRWATHGQVNDTNSHPHNNDILSIVHNGIIENADELRDELKSSDYKFKSETDSEVFLHLVTDHYKKTNDLFGAVVSAFKRVRGHSAFVVLDKATAQILAVKKGAPLVCGTDTVNSQVLVSSDPYALVGFADTIYFPGDNVVCSLSPSHQHLLKFFELDGTPSTRYMSKKQETSLDANEKGDYEHFMLKEIHEQPGLIRSLSQYYFGGEGQQSVLDSVNLKPSRIHITACGTAFYAGMVVRDFIEQYCRIPCSTEFASEFRYRNPIVAKTDMGLYISQSGETADTLASQKLCNELGAKTVSLVNVDGSTLFRDCDVNLLIRAGMEIGVASTKAFTQQVLTGRIFAAGLAGQFGKGSFQKDFTEKTAILADKIDELLLRKDEIKAIAKELYNKEGYFFTGRGIYYPIALEGALKLKEIAYVHAEGYAAGELKHGPIALIDENKVNVALIGPELYEKTLSNIQEIKARRGIILSFGEDRKDLRNISDYFVPLDFTGLDELSPLYMNVACQLFAYYVAKLKGTDIDKPRNLAKSVTVE